MIEIHGGREVSVDPLYPIFFFSNKDCIVNPYFPSSGHLVVILS